ncbi:hypothetical protein OPV22_033817 [Ensete ventricosum]|uniref:Uncharacterized protein n=1 Tax=Ensete ventricosum TaxID=4639 RepID=A0AAV8PQP9_ENSVE|nr:hypothetical protein OPV22_033817 [Ensete ventricosum]
MMVSNEVVVMKQHNSSPSPKFLRCRGHWFLAWSFRREDDNKIPSIRQSDVHQVDNTQSRNPTSSCHRPVLPPIFDSSSHASREISVSVPERVAAIKVIIVRPFPVPSRTEARKGQSRGHEGRATLTRLKINMVYHSLPRA